MSTENNNEKKNNAESLHTQVKYTGFDVDLNQLKSLMDKLEPEFQIEIKKEMAGKLHAGKEMVYLLPFTKSQTENNYFLNSYNATLKRPDLPDISVKIYTDTRIAAREAFNLLEGRSVQKKYNRHNKVEEDGKTTYVPIKDDTYLAWRKLDFTDKDPKGNFKLESFGEKHGFDFEEKLKAIPLQYRPDENDIKDLKKGELLAVTYEKEGTSLKGYIEANPKRWDFILRDADLKPIRDITKTLNQVKANTLAESQSQGVTNESPKEGQNQAVKNDQTQNQGKKEFINKSQAIDKDAATQKKNNRKKSTGIGR